MKKILLGILLLFSVTYGKDYKDMTTKQKLNLSIEEFIKLSAEQQEEILMLKTNDLIIRLDKIDARLSL